MYLRVYTSKNVPQTAQTKLKRTGRSYIIYQLRIKSFIFVIEAIFYIFYIYICLTKDPYNPHFVQNYVLKSPRNI